MLFAAGFGKRMGALTDTCPKPLIEVAGRPLIDHALALVDGLDLKVVANAHYRAEQIETYLAGRDITVIHEEPDILETGGGLKNALPYLGSGPVYTLNTDAVWTGPNPLITLGQAWHEEMECLALLIPKEMAIGHTGKGDFDMASDGRLTRGTDFIYTGVQIVKPKGVADIPQRVFSFNLLWDELLAKGQMFGAVHLGGWCDVGRPEGIALAEAMLADV